MVVKETRIIFRLEDIKKIIIRCHDCKGEVSWTIGPDSKGRSRTAAAEQCPHGPHSWKPDNNSQREDLEAEGKLLDAIEHFTSARFQDRLAGNEVAREFLLELSGDALA